MSLSKKMLIVAIISIISIFMLYNFLVNKSYAAQTTNSDIESIDDSKYPGIKSAIQTLKSQYPNWNFKILYTGLDWNEVIANEYFHTSGENSPRNLVPKDSATYDKAWLCPICGGETHDTGSWVCTSEAAIAYMMDPRNSLNASDVFQFEELTYNNATQTINGINNMSSGTFFAGTTIANSILSGAKSSNMNAYFIVSRIKQEQGTKGGSTVSGTYPGYEGLYNVFNIGASGDSKTSVISNALSYARTQGWTSIGKSIEGGMTFLKNQYINKGQNTLYFQKFDVEETGGIYWHQYMQNLMAAQSEGNTMRRTYNATNTVNAAHTFIIPVYENMPVSNISRPISTSSSTNTSTGISVQYSSHVQDKGWETTWLADGSTSGTTGKNKKVEAMQIKLINAPSGVSIKYRTYVEGIGWQNAVSDGAVAGTIGQNKKMYSIRISLEDTEDYSVMYRAHQQDLGWTDWAYDGDMAGTLNKKKKIEAVQIKIVKKVNNKMKINYNSYVQDVGWQGVVSTEQTSGITGQDKKIEAMQISLANVSADTSIKYSMYLDGIGWQDAVSDGEIAGIVDQNQRAYGIKMELTNSENYAIQYRVYAQGKWQEWTNEAEIAGIVDQKIKIEAVQIKVIDQMSISYSTHVQDKGWLDYTGSGMVSGTVGKNKKVEAMKIKLNNPIDGANIKYSTYVEGIGWQNYVANDELSGTVGENLKIYGFKIELQNAPGYILKYRVHVEDKGWGSWVSNGEVAGEVNSNLKVEAIQIKLIKKETITVDTPEVPEEPDVPILDPEVQYISHVQDYGWEKTWLKDGEQSGTTGKNKKVEAMQIKLVNAPKEMVIKYRTYVEGIGWQDAVSDGTVAGTIGQNKKMYALRISLENTDKYSIQYRVHLQDLGWTDWATDGDIAGTVIKNKKIEAVEIKLIDKVQSQIGVQYISHVQDYSWEKTWLKNGEQSGTTGKNKKVEAMQIQLMNAPADVSIKYSMNIEGLGWQDAVSDGVIAGTIGKNKKVYGIKISLENTNKYSVQYRVHLQDKGWQPLVQDGALGGVSALNKKIEAIEIKVVKK